ncbi:MAG: serine/threonine-protein phosphatase [Spirochaetota bacterium]|nr:serine/threonine-protein phosphatase [Spirochaetota bacterium]
MTALSNSNPENVSSQESSKRKFMQSISLPFVMGLFFVSALMVLLITVVVNIHMERYSAMVAAATTNHLKSAAMAAAKYIDIAELDKYHTEEDTLITEEERKAAEESGETDEDIEHDEAIYKKNHNREYYELKKRLANLAKQYNVLYVYFLRQYDEDHFQYIVDNDFELGTVVGIVGPETILEIQDISRRALSGEVTSSDLGMHDESWEGLIAGFAPVYDKDGNLYCVAGVDISDQVILDQQSYSKTMTILQIVALSVSVLSSALSMFLYRRKAKEIEAAHTKLMESENNLRQAFDEVTELKVQQDGDYFLTSLLINPLLRKEVQSSALAVDFYIDQKKKFIFKKRSAELGGDICIAREIVLRGKRYLAFTNGDAMGKSIQGAGGALVMAVLYNSYIDRTPLSPGLYQKTPEAWLAGIYEELQRVFASFSGSMLISAILGLIDEETGAMYFFNAEHPWLIRYHNGKAAFVENELTMRKIGSIETDTGITIRAMQLQSNEVVFLGSDGRDDILVGIDMETGQRVINEDETRFLHCLEDARGELKRLVENVARDGELTDDFTLIRIEWKKPPPAQPPEFESARASAFKAFANTRDAHTAELLRKAMRFYPDAEVIEKLAVCCREQGKDQEVIQTYQQGLDALPLHETLLYSMVNECRRMIHKIFDESKGKEPAKKSLMEYLRLAIDYGERLLIVQPQHLKGMLHVADCYRMVGRFADAKALLLRARKISPDDDILKTIENSLERDEARRMEKAAPM